MINLKDLIWVEKYRPQTVDEVISIHKNKIKNYIAKSAIPHFLLASKSPGTGKTSTALAIIRDLGCDSLILNSSDDRKIETIREKVNVFSRLQSSKLGVKRCIFLDEIDGTLKPSQNALRNIMETHSRNCFFILTCNNIEKVIDPIQSRCVALDLSNPPKEIIKSYLLDICNKEEVSGDNDSIKKVINRFFPDIRSMVQFLQTVKNDNATLAKATDEYFDKYEKCFELILNKKFLIIKDMVFSGELDPKSFNENNSKATDFFSDRFWNKIKSKELEKRSLVQQRDITQKLSILSAKINNTDINHIEIKIKLEIDEKFTKQEQQKTLKITLIDAKRTSINPFGKQIDNLEELSI